MKSETLFFISWIIFYVLFAYAWFKAVQCVCDPNARQMINLLFGSALVLLLCWSIQMYHGKDVKISKWFMIGATIILAIATIYMWKINMPTAIVLLIATIWLVYQSAIMMSAHRKHGREGEHDSDHEETEEHRA